MYSINHEELKEYMRKAYELKIPTFLQGATGIGKSQAIKEEAKAIAIDEKREFKEWNGLNKAEKAELKANPKAYFVFMDIRATTLEPSDLRGLPNLQGDTVIWRPPEWMDFLSNKDVKGIVFLDELNLAPQSLQSGFYQLILDRTLGEIKISDGVFLIAGGNRAEDKCHVFEMAAALCNRFNWMELQIPDRDSWCKWAIENGIDSRLVAFHNFKQNMIYNFTKDTKDKAFPTPRSNAVAGRAIIGIDNDKMIKMLVSAACGEAFGIEFAAFNKLNKKVDLDEILEHPEKIKEYHEVDMKYSIIGAVAEIYRASIAKKKEKEVLPKILNVAMAMEAEFGALLLKMTKQMSPDKWIKDAIACKNWKQVSDTFSKYLL